MKTPSLPVFWAALLSILLCAPFMAFAADPKEDAKKKPMEEQAPAKTPEEIKKEPAPQTPVDGVKILPIVNTPENNFLTTFESYPFTPDQKTKFDAVKTNSGMGMFNFAPTPAQDAPSSGLMEKKSVPDNETDTQVDVPPEAAKKLEENGSEVTTFFNELWATADTPQKQKQLGELAAQTGDAFNKLGKPYSYKAARDISAKGLERQPDNPYFLHNKAHAEYGMGNHPQAIADATRAIDNNGADERGYTLRSLANYQVRNYSQALEDAKRALALNPNNQTAFRIAKLSVGRVTTAEDLGLTDSQKKLTQQIDREYDSMIQQRNQIEAQPKIVTPKSLASQRTPREDDQILDSLNMKAQSSIKMGDPGSAIRLSSKVLDREPENITALYTRAAAENLMGQYENAVEDATRVIHHDPSHFRAFDTRSLALSNLDPPRAIEALEDADRSISINPESPYAYKNRALAKEKLGDIAGMIADYKIAAGLSPQFDLDLQKASKKYQTMLDPTMLKQLGSPRPAPPETAKKKPTARFLLILASSVTGGLLIAIGLVHMLLGARRERAASPITGAGSETRRALASPGLEAGYKIIKQIGQGGMGVVFEAVDKALNRKVAIKKMRDEIHDDPRERERFLEEARIVAGLHHTNIVDIHSILEDEGDLYMIFEYVEGSTIDQILAKKKRLSVSEAQFIVHGVTNALSYAHSKGVIHRDLKPSNIMITKEGIVKVMDFGIARQAADAMAASTKTNTVAGTPHYMAPEQEQGIVRKESDIFALGACLYEVLTGERPFPSPATTDSKINKRYKKPSRVAGNLPPELDALIDMALEPDPDMRIPTASEFRARLDAIKSTDEQLS